MSNRIFTNGEEGKILTSVGNRIIKQPYEFGNAFQNRMGLGNYIAIHNFPNILFTSFSICAWSNSAFANIFSIKGNNYNNYNLLGTPGAMYFTKNGQPGSLNVLGGAQSLASSASVHVVVINDAVGYKMENNSISVSQTSNITDTSIYKLTIGITQTSVIQTISPSQVSLETHSRVVVFDRAISQQEARYFSNNSLGNELQSTVGLAIDLRCDFAEILDFSTLQDGSDMRVGCRDYSGFNRHGEIINLPAGTLQQKVDYANANLFVPFIQ